MQYPHFYIQNIHCIHILCTLIRYTHFIHIIISIVRDDQKVVPHEIEVTEGSIARFSCISHDIAVWTYGKDLLPDNIITLEKNKELYVKNAIFRNTGKYFCYGRYKDQENHFISFGMLYVYGK